MINHLVSTQPRVLSALPRNKHRIRLNVLNGELHDQRSVAKILRFHFQKILSLQRLRLIAMQLTFTRQLVEKAPFKVVVQPFPKLLRLARAVNWITFFVGHTENRRTKILILNPINFHLISIFQRARVKNISIKKQSARKKYMFAVDL